ncbi:hypothetical protein, partial [Escherichia coli]|uniref:hypothetical protein n=1 Tax=Escherichia coli TaxID=562 RepID=UPI0005C79DDA
ERPAASNGELLSLPIVGVASRVALLHGLVDLGLRVRHLLVEVDQLVLIRRPLAGTHFGLHHLAIGRLYVLRAVATQFRVRVLDG